jgi:DNA-binding transcriptional LysR family regulator
VDIALLKTFLEVRKTRHFGKAADNLHLTQAAVSARIRQLEQLLGVKLFTRSRNNIQLTREGERLVSHAETVLLAWSRARQDVALETTQSSQVHIGVRSGLWNAALQERLQCLHKNMPDVALRTEGHMPDVAITMLLDRTLDIAISYDPPNLPEFRLRAIGELRLQLYSRERQATVQSATADNYVYVDWGSAFARFHARRFGEELAPMLRTNIGESACSFVRKCGGAAYLHSTLVRPYTRSLHPVADAPVFTRTIHAAYRSNSDRVELIETVLDSFEGLEI